MTTEFVSAGIWPALTKAGRSSQKRCAVAVAYFGKGASRLLPITKGSRLVVDASERAVSCGQTCPADLMKLVKLGVAVFSVPNLHAKVFVLGRVAFIGSPNVSNYSANQLVEAVIRTTEVSVVSAARKFVHDHCLHKLTPEVLKQLSKIYRPPRVPGSKRGKRRVADTAKRPTLPRALLTQLQLEDWSEPDQKLHDRGLSVAKKRRQHPQSFALDSFRMPGRCQHQRGDVVVQIVDDGNGRCLVSPPGNVLHVRTRRNGSRQVSFVYLERPTQRRRSIKSLAETLGHGAQKRLRKDGAVRDASFSQSLLKAWAK